MKEKSDSDTEEKILEAARKIFTQRGYFGTRMQEIANEAGINKAMLHYYYRSKDHLFETIFRESAKRIFSQVLAEINEQDTFEGLIRTFMMKYTKIVMENRYLPAFVLHEINHNPERLKDIFDEAINLDLGYFLSIIGKEMSHDKYIEIDPRNLIINMLSLCIFPVIGAPLFRHKMKMSEEEYNEFLRKRADFLPDYFVNSLRK